MSPSLEKTGKFVFGKPFLATLSAALLVLGAATAFLLPTFLDKAREGWQRDDARSKEETSQLFRVQLDDMQRRMCRVESQNDEILRRLPR